MEHKSEDLIFALNMARQSGVIFKKYFGKSHTSWKEDNTPVTQADYEINDFMIRQIAAAYPGDEVYGEEASNTSKSSRVWAIDPVDGTQPFENGIPVCTIVIALIVSGSVKLAVVYDPVLDDMYFCEQGHGAYKNDRPIHCSDSADFAKNYFAASSKMPEGYTSVGAIHDHIDSAGGKVFNLRSFAYCAAKVAEGKLSGGILGIGHLFDTAAAALLVEEAGGRATDLSGNALDYVHGSDGIIVTNGHMHNQFVDLLHPDSTKKTS